MSNTSFFSRLGLGRSLARLAELLGGAFSPLLLIFSALGGLAPWGSGSASPVTATQQASAAPQSAQELDARALLVEGLRAEGIELQPDAGWCSVSATVLTRFEPLEYLLVGERGQNHESLLGTNVRPSSLNAALLALGLEAGVNVRWVEGEIEAADAAARERDESWRGRPAAELHLPEGPGAFLYAAWQRDDETFFFRIEDLLADANRGTSMQRHRFVFLGSKMIRLEPDGPESFAADFEQNLINLALFGEGHTLLTSAVEAATSDDVWYANHWLVPAEGSEVRLVLSTERLSGPPPELLAQLPTLSEPEELEDR